ncbi:hypothetical protein niasHT_030511 [Heterodera trifolii]|uniref:Uncharacterized protein n=1 Tax=Heterodera trifolii TaxID=157864 RepID=A0ABD2ITP8_9BILA
MENLGGWGGGTTTTTPKIGGWGGGGGEGLLLGEREKCEELGGWGWWTGPGPETRRTTTTTTMFDRLRPEKENSESGGGHIGWQKTHKVRPKNEGTTQRDAKSHGQIALWASALKERTAQSASARLSAGKRRGTMRWAIVCVSRRMTFYMDEQKIDVDERVCINQT